MSDHALCYLATTIVVCSGCGQALRIGETFSAAGPVLPAGVDVLVVDPHDCPRTLHP